MSVIIYIYLKTSFIDKEDIYNKTAVVLGKDSHLIKSSHQIC